MKTNFSKALEYHTRGYSVIPVYKTSKKPVVKWTQYQKQIADEEQVEKWFDTEKNYNIGIITGTISGITVIDIDVKNKIKTRHEIFPETYTVRTPSGGYHLYYEYTDKVQTGANQYQQFPYTDIRNDGGYVVAPPSDGYEVIVQKDLAPFPVHLFGGAKAKTKKATDIVEVGSGKRNDSMASVVGKLLAGLSEEQWAEYAWPVVVSINKTYKPPMGEMELKRTFESIARIEKQRRKDVVVSPLQVSNDEAISLRLRKNKSNIPYKDLTNAVFALSASERYAGKIRFETFSGNVYVEGQPKVEEDTLNIQKYLQNELQLQNITKNVVEDAIQLVAFENKYDAAVDYIEKLKWDGVPRVDTWLTSTYHVEENEYTRAIGSNWLRAFIKRIIRPGTKFDNVLVVEGAQGVKKTLSFAVLGGPWHVETIVEAHSKDFLMQFQGKALVELSEGDTLTRSEVKSLKAIITRTHDKYRAPYGRHDEEHPRRCVFCMTTNDDAYLKDETGNRRWWPIRIPDGECADIEWLIENRDQLFAEAYYRIEEDLWRVPEDLAREEQEKRRFVDDMEEDVINWYVTISEKDREEGVTTKDFLDWIYRDHEYKKQPMTNRLDQLRVGSMFRTALKLEKRCKRVGNFVVKRFFPTEKSPDYDKEKALFAQNDAF